MRDRPLLRQGEDHDIDQHLPQAGIAASGLARNQWLQGAGAVLGKRKGTAKLSHKVVAKLVLLPKGKKLLAQAKAELVALRKQVEELKVPEKHGHHDALEPSKKAAKKKAKETRDAKEKERKAARKILAETEVEKGQSSKEATETKNLKAATDNCAKAADHKKKTEAKKSVPAKPLSRPVHIVVPAPVLREAFTGATPTSIGAYIGGLNKLGRLRHQYHLARSHRRYGII